MENPQDEDDVEASRKQKVANLINSIRTRKKSKKKVEMASSEVKVKGKGRHTKYKLRIGWQHYSKGGYHLVTAKTGGGIRTIEYSKDDPQSVATLTDLGKKLFFPDDKSNFGYLSEFTVSLANYKGDAITEFYDLHGNVCSFQEYLKVHGLYSSQFNIYLRTCPIREEIVSTQQSLTCLSFSCNGAVPSIIMLKYSKKKSSLYCSNEVSINCHFLKDCFMLSGLPDQLQDKYNAIEDGFVVSSISIDGNYFLKKTEDGLYHFPQCNQITKETVIVHGPNQIFGIEDNVLLLGLITTRHNDDAICYHWYQNSNLFVSGRNMSVIPIREPGIYVGAVEIEDILYLSDPPVNIVQASNMEKKELPVVTTVPISVNDSHVLQSPTTNNVLSALMSEPLPVDVFQVQPSSRNEFEFPVTTSLPISVNAPHVIYSPSAVTLLPDMTGSSLTDLTSSSLTVNSSCQQSSTSESNEISVLINPPISDNSPCVKQLPLINNVVYASTNSSLLENASRIESGSPQTGHQSARKVSTNKRVSVEEISASHSTKKASVSGISNLDGNNEYFPQASVPQIDVSDLLLGGEIGQGAFGIVLKAEWIGTTVAVKKIKVKRMKIFQNTLEREVQVHSRIRHPNIVQLMAYTTHKDFLYLVSEYIDGYNLEEIIFGKGNPSLNINVKISKSKELLQAVSYLHNIHPIVVHRDIKPENVLVSGNFKIVKLCDMGLSKLKTMTTLVTTFASKQALQPGTPAYQAPELVLERKSATCMSDIWSVSCTILELLTEDQVWNLDEVYEHASDDDDTSILEMISQRMRAKQSPNGISVLYDRSEVPRAIVDVLIRGLSYERDQRPTALEILHVFKSV